MQSTDVVTGRLAYQKIGNEYFIFPRDTYGKSSADRITEFNVNTDQIVAIFSGASSIGGDYFAKPFTHNGKTVKGSNPQKAHLSNTGIAYIWNGGKIGELYYNENGSAAGWGNGGLIATIKTTSKQPLTIGWPHDGFWNFKLGGASDLETLQNSGIKL